MFISKHSKLKLYWNQLWVKHGWDVAHAGCRQQGFRTELLTSSNQKSTEKDWGSSMATAWALWMPLELPEVHMEFADWYIMGKWYLAVPEGRLLSPGSSGSEEEYGAIMKRTGSESQSHMREVYHPLEESPAVLRCCRSHTAGIWTQLSFVYILFVVSAFLIFFFLPRILVRQTEQYCVKGQKDGKRILRFVKIHSRKTK